MLIVPQEHVMAMTDVDEVPPGLIRFRLFSRLCHDLPVDPLRRLPG